MVWPCAVHDRARLRACMLFWRLQRAARARGAGGLCGGGRMLRCDTDGVLGRPDAATRQLKYSANLVLSLGMYTSAVGGADPLGQ